LRRKEEKKLGLFQPSNFDKEAEKKKGREEKDKERQAEKEKKEKVEGALKKIVYDRALKRWNADDETSDYGGEHVQDLLKTMYWM
jgi:hypothetical protein